MLQVIFGVALAALVGLNSWTAVTINEIGKTLSTAVANISDHSGRIKRLEEGSDRNRDRRGDLQ